MEENKKSNRPIATNALFFLIILCVGCLLGGCIIIHSTLSFNEELSKHVPELVFSGLFLTIGIVLLVSIIKQILLRLAWDENSNVEPNLRKISTDEANIYQSMTSNPDLHSEELDKEAGIKYNPKLKKDKYGNISFSSTTIFGADKLTGKKGIGSIIYRIIMLVWILFMVFLAVGYILQETGAPMPENFLKSGVKLILGLFILIIVIGIIYSIYIGIKLWLKIIRGS